MKKFCNTVLYNAKGNPVEICVEDVTVAHNHNGLKKPFPLIVKISAIGILLSACKVALEDCEMALDGRWDKSDEGFEDTASMLRTAIEMATE